MGPCKRYVRTCGHSIAMGCSPFRPLRCSRGTRASFLVCCPSLQQGTGAPQTREMQVLQGEGLAQSFPCPTSEPCVCMTNELTCVKHHTHPHSGYQMALAAAGEGWLWAKQSRRFLWGTGPSMGVPSPGPQCICTNY